MWKIFFLLLEAAIVSAVRRRRHLRSSLPVVGVDSTENSKNQDAAYVYHRSSQWQ